MSDEMRKNGLDAGHLVSIGLPVYNGEAYIVDALECLLSQSYKNIEIIVSDNGSTDRTVEICKKYRSDTRLRLIEHGANQGAVANFQFVLDAARGQYFMWAAYDDIYLPTFVERCLDILRLDSSIDFSYTSLVFIGEDGEKLSTFNKNYDNPDLSSGQASRRLYAWWNQPGWYAIYSLFRTEVARDATLRDMYGSDVIYVSELLMKGHRGKRVEETLFQYRQFEDKSEADRYKAAVVNHKSLPYMQADLFLSLIDLISCKVESGGERLYFKLMLLFIWSDKLRRDYPKILRHYVTSWELIDSIKMVGLLPFLPFHYVRRLFSRKERVVKLER